MAIGTFSMALPDQNLTLGLPKMKKLVTGDYEVKFSKNVAKYMPERQQRQALDYLWTLDRQDSLAKLFDLLVINA